MADETPTPRAPQPTAAQAARAALEEFKLLLRAVTPRLWCVPAIVAANAALFGLMVASGVDAFAPGAERVLAWGANHGPRTLAGEPWRLLASTFLHFGVVHLLMNMAALWDVGRFVERIFGHARFAALYLAAGLCGSVASVVVHPGVVSAGASGAVFGVYGALGGFLLRQRSAIPPPVLSRLGRVALGFLGYNIVFGFTHPNIDVAAHVGGAVAGAVAGAYLARPLAPGRKDPARGVAAVVAACAALVGATVLIASPLGPIRLSTRQLPGFSIDLPQGALLEESSGYQTGRLMMRSAGAPIAVTWQDGGGDRAQLELIARGTASNLGAAGASSIVTLPGPGGASVDTAVVVTDSGTMRVSQLDCGRRQVFLLTFGPPGVEALHRRILPTFACHPDPTQETAGVGIVPVRIDLPGWGATERTGGQVILSDGRAILLVRSGPVVSRASVEDVVGAVFAAMGAQVTARPDGPDAATLAGTFEGDHVEGWARQVRCPGGGALLLLLAPDRPSADRAATLAASARCTRPDEPPQRWPDAPVSNDEGPPGKRLEGPRDGAR